MGNHSDYEETNSYTQLPDIAYLVNSGIGFCNKGGHVPWGSKLRDSDI